MQIHEVILVATVIVCFVLHWRFVHPSYRAARRLEAALRQRDDAFVDGIGWQFRMFRNSKDIFSDSDTPEIRALKQEFYDRWHYSFRVLPISLGVAVGGFALSFIVVLFLRGEP